MTERRVASDGRELGWKQDSRVGAGVLPCFPSLGWREPWGWGGGCVARPRKGTP